ncbi:MAG: ferrous iron transport protein A [Chroococcidiopsidaceae cyanobacterium CP_BM_ER_R8_30]|nr:ferrous iron transport protein A [Chroococcidiopsidaceae cyanobacterium CP_BM_ER_R8_30]
MSTTDLTSLEPGQTATIVKLRAEVGLHQRLHALGFRPGQQVLMLRRAWLNGPLHVRLGTTEVMLRCQEAKGVYTAKAEQ